MDANHSTVRRLQHSVTKDIYFMRFGPPSARFVRDGEPPSSLFTNHGRPRQVSVAYPAEAAARTPPEPIRWDPDPYRPDWAYAQRTHLVEID